MSANSDLSLVIQEPAWKKSGVDFARLRRAARLALWHGLEQRVPLDGPPPPRYARRLPRKRGRKDSLASLPPPLAGEAPRRGGGGQRWTSTLLLTRDERLRELNARFRGKDGPTNVLAFPAAANADGYLGDVAIALGVARREAATYGVSLEAHTLHLAAHGILHLLGYDHALSREARIMERLEIAVLHELGLPSPYARASAG